MHRVAQALTHLAVVFNVKMDDSKLQGYLSLLNGANPEDLVEGIAKLAKESKQFPRPAEILARTRLVSLDRAQRAVKIEEVTEPTPQEREQIQQVIEQYWKRQGRRPEGDGNE